MVRNVAIIAGAILLIVAAGAFYYLRTEPAAPVATVAPLPANAVQYGTWALVGCQGGAGDGACRLVRRVVNNEAQRVVLSFVVTRGPTGNPLVVVGLPPSVVIPAGVTMTPAGGSAARGAVQRCSPQLCTAVVPLSDTLMTELSAAQATNLVFVAANGRNVNVNIPINGFAEGVAAWLMASPTPVEVPPPAEDAPEAPAPG